MNRRQFLQSTLAATAGSALASPAAARLAAMVQETDATITGVTSYRVRFDRPKMVGKNSRLDLHGDHGFENFLKIDTDAGVSGVGWCPAVRPRAERLLGTKLSDWFKPQEKSFSIPFDRGTSPLWDLLGKLQNKPVYELLGANDVERVKVYDGSIYFADLLPEFENDWQDQFRREIDMGRQRGHKAFKVKIGRGAKWMDRQAGNERDVEVIKVIREHGGPELIIGVDANNGYDLEGAKGFMEQVGDLDIAFAEEMFEETVEDCSAFKQFIKEKGWETLVADGETQGNLEVFQPLVEAQAVDVLQGDIRRFNLEGCREMAEMGKPHGVEVAPHNWGSVYGFYMLLQLGRSVENFYMAEQDPGESPVIVAEGFTIRDGEATVPPVPGMGVSLAPEQSPEHVEVRYEVKQ